MEIHELYQLYKETFLVDTDTRNIRSGSLFFALKGANFNGNRFAEQALEKGARYCVVDEPKFATNDQIILVDNALKALQELAVFHRNQLGIPIVGLTGSNGKTTTKELIHSVLKTQFKAEATKGNLNNHIGVPLTLLSFDDSTEIGVVEMGANHQKEIEFLSNIAQPDYGYITNFGKAHLEGFGGVEGVIKGKSELYTFLRENNRTVIVNPSDEKQLELTESMNRVLFQNNTETIATNPLIKLNYKGLEINAKLMGAYNVANILAAVTIGELFKISDENIKRAIEGYLPENNRSQQITTDHNRILLDAYNANPSSVSVALKTFSESEAENKVAILGDMFELGEASEEEHQAIVDFSRELPLNKCFFVGSHYFKTNAVHKYEDFEALKSHLKSDPIKDSYIFIKGSRGMALERLLEIID